MGLWNEVEEDNLKENEKLNLSQETTRDFIINDLIDYSLTNDVRNELFEKLSIKIQDISIEEKEKVLEIFTKNSKLLDSSNSYLNNPIKGMRLISSIIKKNLSKDKTKLEVKFDEFNSFLKNDFIDFSNQISIPNEAELYNKLTNIRDELSEDIKFSELVNKTHIGVGGSFSAGKSSFLNSILGRGIKADDILPIDSIPTTSIPTYIVKKDKNFNLSTDDINIYTFNQDGNRSKIDKESLLAISHEFNKIYDFGLTSIINKIVVDVDTMSYKNIAFLDTPGYSKADGEDNIDQNIAQKHLINADSLIWLIDADNGIIRDGDIQFIKSLDFKGDILFILNKADKKPKQDIINILEAIRETLVKYNIDYKDIVAYSSHDREEYFSDNKINNFLDNKNIVKIIDFKEKTLSILKEYSQYIQDTKNKSSTLLKLFNELDLYGNDIVSSLSDFDKTLNSIKDDRNQNKKDIKAYDKINNSLSEILSSMDKLFNQQIDANSLYQNGRKYFNSEEFEQALKNFKQALELDPKKSLYYFDIGNTYFNMQKYNEAIDNFNKSIELDDSDAMKYYIIGLAYYNLDKIKKAIKNLGMAIELEPSNQDYIDTKIELEKLFNQQLDANSLYQNGRKHFNSEEFSEALKNFEKAIELDDSDAEKYYMLGKTYANMEEYNKAIDNFNIAIELDDSDAEKYYILGLAYAYIEEYNKAIKNLEIAIEIEPSNQDYIDTKIELEKLI